MLPHVIALCSPSRSGKDTFYTHAARLAPSLGLRPMRAAYADQLKVEVANAFGYPCTPEALDGPAKEQWRPLLKAWSQTRKSALGHGYWALKLDGLWREYDRSTLIVVTDLSFQVEKDLIEQRLPRENVTYVRIHRTDLGYQEPDTEHESDWGRAHLPVDLTVENPGTDSFGLFVESALRRILSLSDSQLLTTRVKEQGPN